MDEHLTQKGTETRKRILESATHVVAKKGIEKASVTQIARHAKVSRALLPYYVPKKDQLLIGLIEFIAGEAYGYFEKNKPKMKRSSALPTEIETRVRLNFHFFIEHPHYFQCFMLFYYRCSYDSECHALNQKLTERATSIFVTALSQQKIPSQIVARLGSCLYRMMFSSIQQNFIFEDKKKLSLENQIQKSLEELEWLLSSKIFLKK